MTAFFLALWTKIRGWVLGAVAIVATFVTVYVMGRKSGRHEAELEESRNDVNEARKVQQEIQDTVKARQDIENDIASRPANSSLERLRNRWGHRGKGD